MNKRIRKLREARGISQARFAHILNINYTQYNKYETGKVKIPAELLLAISKELGVSVDYILTGKKEAPSPTGMLKDEVFARLLDALASSDVEDFQAEELSMMRGTTRLLTEFLRRKRRPRPSKR